jgi:hypothetical protein
MNGKEKENRTTDRKAREEADDVDPRSLTK